MENNPTSPEVNETQATETQTETQTTETPYVITDDAGQENTVVTETEQEQETLYADKFKSVSDLENSYKELQSTFSKKLGDFTGAPESYQLEEGVELTPDETNMVQNLQAWGTENQLSQEGFESLVGQYTEWQDTANESRLNAEYEKLGENADYRLQNVTDFLKQNVGEELTDSLAQNMMTADAVTAIEKLIDLSKVQTPTAPAVQTQSKEKIQSMRFAVNENGDRLMSVDPDYRARVLKLESQL